MAAGALACALGWLAITGALARADLKRAAADAASLQNQVAAGDVAAATASADDLLRRSARARRLTGGPIWSAAGALPFVGSAPRVVRGLTGSLDLLGREALRPLVAAGLGTGLNSVRRADGSLDLDRMIALTPAVDRAASAVDSAIAELVALPTHTWPASLGAARTNLVDRLVRARGGLHTATLALRLLPPMLGRDTERTYLLVFQNEAEARGTGGLPGAFALAHLVDGRVRIDHMDSRRVLAGTSGMANFGADYDRLYAAAATTTLYGNANLGPHFPYAAAIWASMWQRQSGRPVDGVLALDPTVLSYLLRAAGPTALPDGTPVTADNVVSLTERSAYASFPGTDIAQDTARRAFLAGIETVVSARLLGVSGNGTAVASALAQAAGERRLLVWSARPAEQAQLERTVVAGAVPQTNAPYVGLSIVNEGGNKLDYYLDRTLSWQRVGCGRERRVTVTVTLTNNAPASGLSPVVTSRSDQHPYPIQPGDNRLTVSYLATQGAAMTSVTLDGSPWSATSALMLGHPMFGVDVELPHGVTRRLVINLTEPAGDPVAPIVLRQPLIRPLDVRLDDQPCARR